MSFTGIWSDFRLKELSIEFKNVRIGVWTRKIWLYEVGSLEVCRGAMQLSLNPHNCVPEGCNFEAQSCNSVPENIRGSYCTPNFNPK